MTEPLTTPPVDILDELKAEFEEWDARDGVTAVVSILLLRDAISEIERLRAALRTAQGAFADVAASDRVDEIEDVLNPGWRERWYSEGMPFPGEEG